ncbi:hypothetical protein LI142_15905 [Eubacterium limosum]|uniref:Zinc ribbon domain-containing protein n=1 Tax=Eubacterium limosum TaxID=1736 RepID=A0ABT5UTI2_EUBLI|nr:hypothetical protein [Eubacterium limosum]MCB6570986.1 hypothetical protein [Eubacterium limosum]MDE1472264.1 hypothetical protein [Eubacterium limosum]
MAATVDVTNRKRRDTRKKEDQSYKGRLIKIERSIDENAFGRKRFCHRFTVQGVLSRKIFEHLGDMSLDLRDYYRQGEKVIHFAGYSIPAKENKHTLEKRICIECGELVPVRQVYCSYCGSKAWKLEQLFLKENYRKKRGKYFEKRI